MSRTSKETLKGYFKAGAIPTESNFTDLVDSVLITDPAGSVGIGTATPRAMLEVSSATLATATVNTELISRWTRPTTENVKWPNTFDILLGSYSNSNKCNTRVDFKLSDGETAGTDKSVMTLLADGKVGIGTVAPQAVLDVSSSVRAAGAINTELISRWSRPRTENIKWPNTFDLLIGSYSDKVDANTRVDFKLNNGAQDTPEITVMTLQANGKVGIGTTAPANAKLVIAGNDGEEGLDLASTNQLANLRVIRNSLGSDNDMYIGHGSGANSSLHLYCNNAETITVKDGKVGIGITSPSTAKLVIAGTAGGEGLDLATSDLYANLRVIRNSLGSDKDMYIGHGSGANSSLHLFSNNAEAVTIKSGNLGVGTTTPQTMLEITSPVKATAAINTELISRWSRPRTEHVKWPNTFDLQIGSYSKEVFANTRVDFKLNNGAQDTPDMTVMTLQANGNVGIGTTTPNTAKLVIAGNGGAEGLDLATSDQYANLRVIRNSLGPDKDMYIGQGSGASSSLRLFSNNNETLTVKDGNIGIGTTKPNAMLEVLSRTMTTSAPGTELVSRWSRPTLQGKKYGGIFDIFLGSYVEDSGTTRAHSRVDFRLCEGEWSASGTDMTVMTLNANGRVGIGTADPKYKLDVNGDLNVNGNITASGKITPSDARIKNIIGISDTAEDLAVLSNIEVTNYTMRDQMNHPGVLHKKIIAQQVQNVYPAAVMKSGVPHYVPDVYQPAASYHAEGNQITVQLSAKLAGDNNIHIGGRCKFYLTATDGTSKEFNGGIVELQDTKLVLSVTEKIDYETYTGELFLYGSQIDDMLLVDYDALAMLNLSATQELAKMVVSMQTEIDTLKAELADI